jgi:signal transduction histidine kinase
VHGSSGRSPTPGLFVGLLVTVVVVVAYSWYITQQISGLRQLQNNLADRNRKDSLQLLRIQNELNSLALAMRDMLDNDEPYPLTAWTAQFQRMRTDLDDALRQEQQFAYGDRTPEQRQYLESSLSQFWDAVDRTFALARDGKEAEARAQIRLSLQARLEALNTAVARLLVQNNESEEQAGERIKSIYDHVERQVYLFLTAALTAILLTSFYVIRSNRRLFTQVAALSEQRSELAQKLISTQEATLRYISRELHDEFGQILTAMGSMLGRAGNHVPTDSPLRPELVEVREIAQAALDKVRSLSQALHPVMLEEAGLERALDWYLPVVEKQSGIKITYEKSGTAFGVEGNAAIHVYRVVQEAVNNAVRHSGTDRVWVRLIFLPDKVGLEVEDHGCGFAPGGDRHGIGLVAMRERAELLGGTIAFLRPELGGTLIRLSVPREVAGEKSHKKVSFPESTVAENTSAEAPGAERSKGERSHG